MLLQLLRVIYEQIRSKTCRRQHLLVAIRVVMLVVLILRCHRFGAGTTVVISAAVAVVVVVVSAAASVVAATVAIQMV